MKKFFSAFLFLVVCVGINAQVIEFDSSTFKHNILNTKQYNFEKEEVTIDINNDGEIDVEEALKVTRLKVFNRFGISDVSDIRHFKNLKELELSGVSIRIDINLTALTELEIFKIRAVNGLKSITFPENSKLKKVELEDSRLIDLGLSKLQNLEELVLYDEDITSLDLSNNIHLKGLKVQSCENLINLNFSELKELTSLSLYSNNINTINLEGVSNLTHLSIQDSTLTSIDLKNQTRLTSLNIDDAPISSLELSSNIMLDSLYLSNNRLSKLNLSNNTKLLNIKIYHNNLKELEVSECVNLNILEYYSRVNETTPVKINVSKLNKLKDLQCTTTEKVDISNNVNLERLYLHTSPVESIDLNLYPNLEHFGLDNVPINKVDISSHPDLKTFYLHNISISKVDFSKNPNIEDVSIVNTDVVNLDFSNNTKLKYLGCSDNKLLKSINLKGTPLNSYNFSHPDWYTAKPDLNQNLESICIEDNRKASFENRLNELGYQNLFLSPFCSFTPGGKYYTIKGKNVNCEDDSISIPFLKYKITNEEEEGVIVSNELGDYNYHLREGTYTITPVQNTNHYTVTPESIEVTFPTEETNTLVKGFCFTPKSIHDVEIVIAPIGTPARPGFDSRYKIKYTNKGFNTVSGDVILTYMHDFLDFVNADTTEESHSAGRLTWSYVDLKPFESREIEVTFNTNSPMETPAVNNGDILKFIAHINPITLDKNPQDNSHELKQTVVGSYDPNDKTCLEGTDVLEDMIGKYVHYRIRFENIGTFAAENIVVVDEIDESKFDVSTLVPLDASHDFETRITGNKVEFIFEGIQLPFDDATNDGYVIFKIKTLPNLKLGDSFSNQASIYFDFNFPIITNNETTTIVEEHLGVGDFDFADELTVYPNPVADRLYITPKNDTLLQSLEIYNLQGQMVLSVPQVSKMSFEVSHLPKGTYLVKVKTDRGESVTKIVKD